MKVFGLNLSKEPLTTPYPKSTGIILRLLGGDVIYPLGSEGNWFKEPYFKHRIKFYMPIPILPFISVRIGRFGFYFGSKPFGVDAPEYAHWMCKPEDVYEWSQALMLISIRFTGSLNDG